MRTNFFQSNVNERKYEIECKQEELERRKEALVELEKDENFQDKELNMLIFEERIADIQELENRINNTIGKQIAKKAYEITESGQDCVVILDLKTENIEAIPFPDMKHKKGLVLYCLEKDWKEQKIIDMYCILESYDEWEKLQKIYGEEADYMNKYQLKAIGVDLEKELIRNISYMMSF